MITLLFILLPFLLSLWFPVPTLDATPLQVDTGNHIKRAWEKPADLTDIYLAPITTNTDFRKEPLTFLFMDDGNLQYVLEDKVLETSFPIQVGLTFNLSGYTITFQTKGVRIGNPTIVNDNLLVFNWTQPTGNITTTTYNGTGTPSFLKIGICFTNSTKTTLTDEDNIAYYPIISATPNASSYNPAYNAGYNKGYDQGHQRGYNEGKNDGYTEGKADGDREGYDRGYLKGQEDLGESGQGFLTLVGGIAQTPITILSGLSDLTFLNTPIMSIVLTLLFLVLALALIKRLV